MTRAKDLKRAPSRNPQFGDRGHRSLVQVEVRCPRCSHILNAFGPAALDVRLLAPFSGFRPLGQAESIGLDADAMGLMFHINLWNASGSLSLWPTMLDIYGVTHLLELATAMGLLQFTPECRPWQSWCPECQLRCEVTSDEVRGAEEARHLRRLPDEYDPGPKVATIRARAAQ